MSRDDANSTDKARSRHASDRQQTLAALREGLADIRAGRTKPARTALKALAKKYGIAPDEK